MCVWTGGGVIFWTRCWEIDVVWTGGRWTCVYVFCIWGGVIDMHSFEDFLNLIINHLLLIQNAFLFYYYYSY